MKAAANILRLPVERAKPARSEDRFNISEFDNRSGSRSWRVGGYKRDGTRVRENFTNETAAKARKIEMETEYLRGHAEVDVRATRLSQEQIGIAEAAFNRLGVDNYKELSLAVEHWLRDGRQAHVAESPRLDDAVLKFNEWLQGSTFRERTKGNLRLRVSIFQNSIGNRRVSEIMPEHIDAFLDGRNASASTKDNDRRAVSRFFTWCMDRKRRWTTVNPCRAVKVEQGKRNPPTVLSLDQCKALLNAAANYKGGRLAPYVAVCLFGGLRPFEAQRLTWQQVNLKDGEIRLEANQTKTGKARTIEICETLRAWLKAYERTDFFPSNWRKDFDAVKVQVGFGPEKRIVNGKPVETGLKPWPDDVMRHTAISHYFRQSGSYGRTAEQFGNSEAIIKDHYQARVSSDDTNAFYSMLPRSKKK